MNSKQFFHSVRIKTLSHFLFVSSIFSQFLYPGFVVFLYPGFSQPLLCFFFDPFLCIFSASSSGGLPKITLSCCMYSLMSWEWDQRDQCCEKLSKSLVLLNVFLWQDSMPVQMITIPSPSGYQAPNSSFLISFICKNARSHTYT